MDWGVLYSTPLRLETKKLLGDVTKAQTQILQQFGSIADDLVVQQNRMQPA